MSAGAQPTSIRLSDATLRLLDNRAKETSRSRSYIVEEALQRHLRADSAHVRLKRLETLAELRKRSDTITVRLNAASVEARSRVFRGED